MSTYNETLTWGDVSSLGGSEAGNVCSVLYSALRSYNKWQSFRNGRTNAQIATDLAETGITETDVAALDSNFAAFKALYDKANNQVVTQGDYFFSMLKFAPRG